MSSASIMAAIRRKENEIVECNMMIQELEVKIEKQQIAFRKFTSHSEEFEYMIGVKRKKVDAVSKHVSVNNLADKFALKMDTVFNASTWNQQKSDMGDISTNMDHEIAYNEAELDRQKRRLTALRNELSALQSEYQAAVRREQAAAARRKRRG